MSVFLSLIHIDVCIRDRDEAARALVLKKEGALPMRPGADQNAILTFVAPRAGTLNILATEAVRAGGGDGTGLSIILNRNQQLWPGDGAAFLLDDAGGNRVAVPAITGLQVEEGDLISFVADIGKVGGDNQGDEVVWPCLLYTSIFCPSLTRATWCSLPSAGSFSLVT